MTKPLFTMRIHRLDTDYSMRFAFFSGSAGVRIALEDRWSGEDPPYSVKGTISLDDYDAFQAGVGAELRQLSGPTNAPKAAEIAIEIPTNEPAVVYDELGSPLVQFCRAFLFDSCSRPTCQLQHLEPAAGPEKSVNGWLILLLVLVPYSVFVVGLDWLGSCVGG